MTAINWLWGLFAPEKKPKEKLIRFPKGTVITCPLCGKKIGTAKRDVRSGERMRSDAWDSEYIAPLFALTCPDDKKLYVRMIHGRTQLHTKEGWI